MRVSPLVPAVRPELPPESVTTEPAEMVNGPANTLLPLSVSAPPEAPTEPVKVLFPARVKLPAPPKRRLTTSVPLLATDELMMTGSVALSLSRVKVAGEPVSKLPVVSNPSFGAVPIVRPPEAAVCQMMPPVSSPILRMSVEFVGLMTAGPALASIISEPIVVTGLVKVMSPDMPPLTMRTLLAIPSGMAPPRRVTSAKAPV